MVEGAGVDLRRCAHTSGAHVVVARGRVELSSVAALRDGLVKLLADGTPVLLDLAELALDWPPAPELFVTAVAAAGGWPRARLVLFGADEHTTDRLRACRVPDAIPLAATVDEAAALVDVRPARLTRVVELTPDAASVRQAREILRDACGTWGLPEPPDAGRVVAELVDNAVRHARTALRLRLVLDRAGLRVSVRDHHTGPFPDVTGPDAPRRGGLHTVSLVARTWGVLRYGDGKAVWAQLPLTRARVTPAVTRRPERVEPATGGLLVSTPRRRRFTTADPEHAHTFLRTVYGEHTLRLPGVTETPGFHLEYTGVTTNLFAVERLAHGGAVEGRFTSPSTLVVLHALDGELRITSGRDALRAGPGDVVLCGSGADVLVDSARSAVEVVRLRPDAVARVTAELTGFATQSIPLELSRPLSVARGAYWRATVSHLRRDVLGNDEVLAGPLCRGAVLRSLVAALVEAFPNPALAALTGESGPPAPRAVRRAVAFMEEHAAGDIGLAEIAAASGIGARGLQLAFRRHCDLTPLEYLRRIRLGHAHRELEAADPTRATVGRIADRWGFPHHGNFSALYLRTYGRSPSVTLRS